MSTGSYPKYTDEFKKSIVTLHQNGKSLTQLSKEYGISMSALSRWVRLFSEVKIDEDTVVTAQQIKTSLHSHAYKRLNLSTTIARLRSPMRQLLSFVNTYMMLLERGYGLKVDIFLTL